MMTDPIADMLTRLRNSSLARHERVELPYSKIREEVAKVLRGEGFVDEVRVQEGTPFRTLVVILRYVKDKQCAFDGLRRVSTPGRRVYVAHDRIPRVRSGLGVSILSTSRGVMTDREARRQRVGGELLCEVW